MNETVYFEFVIYYIERNNAQTRQKGRFIGGLGLEIRQNGA